jgi:hypothetical protein
MYYWYYASLAMHQYGGGAWKRWNERMMPALLKSQRIDPDLPNEARQELRAAFNAFDKAVDAVVKEAQIHP